MDPMTLALIFGGGTTLKGELLDNPAESKKALIEAQKTRYSPWTGVVGKDANFQDNLGKGVEAGVQGYTLGTNLNRAAKENEMMDAYADSLRSKAGATPWNPVPQSNGLGQNLQMKDAFSGR